jgi:lambda family phage portal protein
MMGVVRDMLSEGVLGRFFTPPARAARNEYDGGRQGRRLKTWQPTRNTINAILSSSGELLRSRTRDALRNNPHAVAASDSLVANLIGTGIKPSSLLTDEADLRDQIMQLWLDWTDTCDADGLADFYGLQTMVARALFEAGECFIRYRPRRPEDGLAVPLQIQLLESEMCPYHLNQVGDNGNWIMNGIELDWRGARVAYWFYPTHPGDAAIEGTPLGMQQMRIPATEVLHIFKCTRPGQMRGVPLITPALVRMFLMESFDDAEVERKRIAAMYAGFVTGPVPEDVVEKVDPETGQIIEPLSRYNRFNEVQDELTPLEPGVLQLLYPGEDIKFSEPADVGGGYEAFQYRQQLAMFSALGIPYSLCTSDLRRANYSSLRGSIVEYRRKLEQMQHNIFVYQMCRPIWRRWMDTAVLARALPIDASQYLAEVTEFQRAKWIPQRNDWVDPLKDRQAEKLAVDAGFKSRGDVIEAEGYDPEETDRRIAADQERAKRLDLVFAVHTAAATQPLPPSEQAAQDAAQQEAANQAAQDAADQAAADDAAA